MSRSKSMDETIKSILGWFFFGSIAFLFFANLVGWAMAFGVVFIIVPLFLPFVFLIIGLKKDPKPLTFRETSYQADHNPRSSWESIWPDDMDNGFGSSFTHNHEDLFSSNDSSFSDTFSTESSFSDDMMFNPIYSSFECNIYHTDDINIPSSSSSDDY